MKQSIFCTLFVVAAQIAAAQPTLNYSTHSLMPGENNPMTLCEYMKPGTCGENVVWDYSNLKVIQSFTGNINMVVSNSNFSDATTELEEFGTSFFFKDHEKSLLQVGYASKDLRTKVIYYQPYEKMRFPLSMGQSFSCSFSGDYTFDEKTIGAIDGEGLLEADAWGGLKLPNNKTYLNTLRVKSIKTYTVNYTSQGSQKVDVITYRWYNSAHRYPLLVLTEYTVTSGKDVSTNYQAAYNNNAVDGPSNVNNISEGSSFEIYPNPTEAELTIRILSKSNSAAQLQVFDLTGKAVVDMEEIMLAQGSNFITLTTEISVLKPGTYMIKIINDNQTSIRQFILTD